MAKGILILNDKHVNSNKEYTKMWCDVANENKSLLFLCLGVNKAGDLQVYPIETVDMENIPEMLRECADRIEAGNKS